MPKDLKIGIILGLVIVAGLAFLLATQKSLSVKSRMVESQQSQPLSNKENLAFIGKSQPKPVLPAKPKIEAKQPPLSDVVKQPDNPKTPRIHVVVSGDTLSNISDKYYGDLNKWKKILAANPAITNPNTLRLGMRLIIPE